MLKLWDHLAFRVKDRYKTAKFFMEALDYKVQKEFQISFDDGSVAECVALESKTKLGLDVPFMQSIILPVDRTQIYQLVPEIFVSDGPEGSIVGDWVRARSGVGGLHHAAIRVDSVEEVVNDWKAKGYAEFTSDSPMVCDKDTDKELKQIFTKPSELLGIIIELIERKGYGFCEKNVGRLMESTRNYA